MSNVKKYVLYAIAAQFPIAVLAMNFAIEKEALAGALSMWGTAPVIGFAILFEIAGIAAVYFFQKERTVIRDERENLIEQKSYRASFQILMIVVGCLMFSNWVKPSEHPFFMLIVLIAVANFARSISQAYYRWTV